MKFARFSRLAGMLILIAAAAATAMASEVPTLVLPEKDPAMQASLEAVLASPSYRKLTSSRALSVSLVDLSEPGRMRYAGVQDDEMRYAASVPKLAILLTVFSQVEAGKLSYTSKLKKDLEQMIRRSSNRISTRLIERVGFQSIADTLRNPSYELYHANRQGGLWVGRDYGGGRGLWRRDPLRQISHGATTRQVARFMVMMDRGMLGSTWASEEMKRICGQPEIKHKFVKGLEARPGSTIYRKSGTWNKFHGDAALVERDGKKYVATALMVNPSGKGVLARLILALDDIIHRPSPPVLP